VVKIDTLSVTKIDSTTVYGNGISKTIGEQDVTSFTVSYIVSNPDSTSVEVTLQSSPDGITWFALNTAITVTENGQIVYSTASTQRFFRIYQAKDADSTGNIRYYWIFGGR